MRMYFLFFAVLWSGVWSVVVWAQTAPVAADRRSADEVPPLTLQVALDEALTQIGKPPPLAVRRAEVRPL